MESMEVATLSYDVIKPTGGEESSNGPIILLHGMTSVRQSWNRVSQELADKTGRTVYVLDARNHGDSEYKNEHNYAAMANDVSHFMHGHGIATAVIVGHSMGGKAGMALATSQPEKVEMLIVEDMTPRKLKVDSKRYAYRYLDLLREALTVLPPDADLPTAKKIAAQYIHANMPVIHQSSSPDMSGSHLPLHKNDEGRFIWKVNLDVIEKSFFAPDDPRNEVKGTFIKPAYFIYGTKSPYDVPNDEDLILKMFPHARFYGVLDGTHLVHADQPQIFVSKVADFINGVRDQKS